VKLFGHAHMLGALPGKEAENPFRVCHLLFSPLLCSFFPPKRILHVGQSIYHDVLPAQSLGLATVWVNRPSTRSGIGAVKQAEGQPDLRVSDLATLANYAGG